MSTTEAGRLVAQSIAAHGGLATWLAKGTIEFDYDYAPVGAKSERRYSRNHVDLYRARAVHEALGEGATARFGYNGEAAWITPAKDAFPSGPRFWSTTPFYFVGIPFVLADEGAVYTRLPDAPLDGAPHALVKVSYAPGTGDSPDDYYVLYLAPKTNRVAAIRYVVAYPGYFAKGMHSPEKLMRYGEQKTIDGLTIATRYATHAWGQDTQNIGVVVTEIRVDNVAFGATLEGARFDPPAGAHVSTEIEAKE